MLRYALHAPYMLTNSEAAELLAHMRREVARPNAVVMLPPGFTITEYHSGRHPSPAFLSRARAQVR